MDVDAWDDRYSASRVWSGHPNEALVSLAPAATVRPSGPPWALDLGCGEGADAIWLAQQGWHVVGMDWSRVALERGRAAAANAGVDVSFVEGDVTDCQAAAAQSPTGTFDLVSAAYLHPEPEQRDRVFGSLSRLVAPGGHLFVVAHDPEHGQLGLPGPPQHRLLSVTDLLAALELPGDFEVLVRMAAPRRRDAEVAAEVTAVDSVILARRVDSVV